MEVKGQKTLHKNPRFTVEEMVYATEEDQLRKTVFIRPPFDLVVLIGRQKDKLLLVEQMVPPYPQVQFAFPTGYVKPGIAIADVAQNILLSNAGLAAQRYIYAGKFAPSKYIDQIAHVMIAEDMRRVKNRAEDFQDKSYLLSEKEVAQLLMSRKIDDGLVLASYVYYVTSKHYWTEVHGGTRNTDRSIETDR